MGDDFESFAYGASFTAIVSFLVTGAAGLVGLVPEAEVAKYTIFTISVITVCLLLLAEFSSDSEQSLDADELEA